MQFRKFKRLLAVGKKGVTSFGWMLLSMAMLSANAAPQEAIEEPMQLFEQLIAKVKQSKLSHEQQQTLVNDQAILASSYYLAGLSAQGKNLVQSLPQESDFYQDHTLVILVAVLSQKASGDLAELAKRINLPATDSFEVDVARYELFPDQQTASIFIGDLINDKPKKNDWFILQDWADTYKDQTLLLNTATIDQLLTASASSQYTFGSWLAESSLATSNPNKAKQAALIASKGLQALQAMPNNRVNENQILRVAKNLAKFGYSKEAISMIKPLLGWERLGEYLLNKDNVILFQVIKENDSTLYNQLQQLTQQRADTPNYNELGDIYNKSLWSAMLLAIPDKAVADKNLAELFQTKHFASTSTYDVVAKVKVLPLVDGKQKATLINQLYQEAERMADASLSTYRDLVKELVKQGLITEATTLSEQINKAYLEFAKRSDINHSQLMDIRQNLVAIWFAVQQDDKAFALLKQYPELLAGVSTLNTQDVDSGIVNARRAAQFGTLFPTMTVQGFWPSMFSRICPQATTDCQQLMTITLQEQSRQMAKASQVKDLQFILLDVMRLEYLSYLWKNHISYNN